MDLFWFRDLANLADTGNFSQAAELGHISQPAFSRRIKALEAWVGVALVDRSRHPVTLTSAGIQILEAGQQSLARIESECRLIREAQTRPDRYVVTFAAQHSIGWRYYPSWLQAFENAFGPIMSRLRADDLPNCLADLRAGEVDFLIAYDSDGVRLASEAPDTESLVIGHDHLLPVCKRGSDGQPLFDFSSRMEIPYLWFGKAAPMSQHVEPLLVAHALTDRLRVVYENAMSGALRIRAREGAGVAWLPASLIAPDLDAKVLVPTGEPDWQIALEIRLHRLRTSNNPFTEKIWSFLSAREGLPLTVQF